MLGWGGFCVFYLLAFGAKHGDEVARLWLRALFLGWFQKTFLNEPQIVFLKHVLFPLILVRSLERSMATTSRWHLLHHVFVHSARLNNRALPVGAVHRLASENVRGREEGENEGEKKGELSRGSKKDKFGAIAVSKYILQHVELPMALKSDRGIAQVNAEKDDGEEDGDYVFNSEVGEIDPALKKMTRCDRYFRLLQLASGNKKIRMILDGAVFIARAGAKQSPGGSSSFVPAALHQKADSFENGVTRGIHEAESLALRFKKGMGMMNSNGAAFRGRFGGWKRLLLVLIFFPALLGVLLAALDELGVGDAALMVGQAALVWVAGENKWIVLGVVMFPPVVLLVSVSLAYFGRLRLGNEVLVVGGKKNKGALRKSFSNDFLGRLGVIRRIRDRRQEEGLFVEGVGEAVVMYCWENSIFEWIWNWGRETVAGVRSEGAWWTLVVNGFVARGLSRVAISWRDWREDVAKRDAVVYVVKEEEKEEASREKKMEDEKRREQKRVDEENDAEEALEESLILQLADDLLQLVTKRVVAEAFRAAEDEAIGDEIARLEKEEQMRLLREKEEETVRSTAPTTEDEAIGDEIALLEKEERMRLLREKEEETVKSTAPTMSKKPLSSPFDEDDLTEQLAENLLPLVTKTVVEEAFRAAVDEAIGTAQFEETISPKLV